MDGCNEGANNCTGMSPELSTCIGGSTNCNDQCMSGVCVNNNQG
jgi:hypothetical protein